MSNNFSNTNSPTHAEEVELINFSAIWNSVRLHWVMLAVCIIVGMLAATALWATLPAKWQASATLQVGQLPMNPTTLTEPTAQAAERFKQRQLQDEALKAAGLLLNEDSDRRTRLFRATLKATPGKTTDFVDVSVAAFSQAEAKTNLNAALQALIHAHELLLAPMIKNLDNRLEANTLQMTQAITEKTRLETSLKSAAMTSTGAKFEPSVVAINLLSKQEDLIRGLTSEHSALVDLRTKTNTFPTKIVDAIFVPEQPFFPKLTMLLLSGLIIGAIAGVLLAMFRDRNLAKA
ncbi:chain length determinant family protein [Collimonas fungivorans]|uniref:Chain length determinant family protein n=1 Tax=Collimonas fungivorans TaxID=158899 RepID=A0A127P9C3_9BURK|nr:Wzz/FepE/Etk N-terminal domain-containing protein [Collimonas fungivorans]AMO94031.1 chain length determinant family protein [Collimonas fungivorans]